MTGLNGAGLALKAALPSTKAAQAALDFAESRLADEIGRTREHLNDDEDKEEKHVDRPDSSTAGGAAASAPEGEPADEPGRLGGDHEQA